MTRDDIIRMAHEADCLDDQHYGTVWANKLERFAQLVAAHEREACAQVCDNLIRHGNVAEVQQRYNQAYKRCQDAIRARGTK